MAGPLRPGDAGRAVPSGSDLAVADLILRKGADPGIDSYSAFVENDRTTRTGLAGYLRERGCERVFLAGLAFDFCVLWSAEDARHAGFEAVVIEDACRGLDIEGSNAKARARLQALEVPLVSSGDLIMRTAGIGPVVTQVKLSPPTRVQF